MRPIDADVLRDNMQWAIDHGMYDKPYDYLAEIDDAQTVNEWIPVSERLPEKDGSYLVCMNWNYNDMDVLKWADGWNCIRRINGNVDRESEIDGADIVAWMPLPEPYREEDET